MRRVVVLNATCEAGGRRHYVVDVRESGIIDAPQLYPVALCGAGRFRQATWGRPLYALSLAAGPITCRRCRRKRPRITVMDDMTATAMSAASGVPLGLGKP